MIRKHIKASASLACLALFANAVGCSTATSLGLPFASGPHKLTSTAKEFRKSAGYPASLPRELAKGVMPVYRVEAGDVLIVEPDSFDSTIRLPSEQLVQPEGTIELGRFGDVFVAGKTVREIEADVRAIIERQLLEESRDLPDDDPNKFSKDDASVSVRLTNRESKVFYVLGEVNAPGAYPLVGRETILDAILTAGGLTDGANEHDLIFIRPRQPGECRVVLPVCYRQIVQLGDTSTNYQVMPGDRIYIPSMTLHDDLKQLFTNCHDDTCPRCADTQSSCYADPPCDGSCSTCATISESALTPPQVAVESCSD